MTANSSRALVTNALNADANRATWRLTETTSLGASSEVELVWQGVCLCRFQWGRFDAFGTAAYWADQASREAPYVRYAGPLVEQVAFCVLGGYGVTYEMNLAAFRALQHSGLLHQQPVPSAEAFDRLLTQPLQLANADKLVRYRFPHQRAVRLAACVRALAVASPPEDPVDLRDMLHGLPGIGPKTASWIVRNYLGTDRVAIIDIHLRRAGIAAGFFRQSWMLPRDYALFEAAFLGYADCAGVAASALDFEIWKQMRQLSRVTANMRPRILARSS